MEKEKIRPLYHVTADKGWINDPNGLVYFNGEYHVFYQHYPHDVHWGPMHWGHIASSDLKTWRRLPIALYPGDDGDKNGCFSGCSVVWKDKVWFIYTGFNENGGGENIRQVQCLASSSDGIHFEKHGVIIDETNLPEGYSPCDFRDPNVWFDGENFNLIVAVRRKDGNGRILFYRSKDLFNWTFVNDLFGKDSKGSMIECPDYVKPNGLLLVSEQFAGREGNIHLNLHTNRWYTGKMDEQNGKFIAENDGIIDYGFDFYAPQTFFNDNVMIGWLQMWDRNIPSEKYGFAGMLTCPRRVEIKNGEFYQTPVVSGKIALKESVKNNFTDLAQTGILKIDATNLKEFSLKLRKKGDNYALLKLENQQWIFDRSKAGEEIKGVETDELSLSGIRVMPCDNQSKQGITIVMDLFSVEIFINGKSLTSTIYPDLDSNGVELEVVADLCDYERLVQDGSVEN